MLLATNQILKQAPWLHLLPIDSNCYNLKENFFFKNILKLYFLQSIKRKYYKIKCKLVNVAGNKSNLDASSLAPSAPNSLFLL